VWFGNQKWSQPQGGLPPAPAVTAGQTPALAAAPDHIPARYWDPA
jgi:hypothetical protein